MDDTRVRGINARRQLDCVRCTHDVHSQSAHVRRRSGKSPSFGFCQVDMYAISTACVHITVAELNTLSDRKGIRDIRSAV